MFNKIRSLYKIQYHCKKSRSLFSRVRIRILFSILNLSLTYYIILLVDYRHIAVCIKRWSTHYKDLLVAKGLSNDYLQALHWDGFVPSKESQINLKKLFCAALCISLEFTPLIVIVGTKERSGFNSCVFLPYSTNNSLDRELLIHSLMFACVCSFNPSFSAHSRTEDGGNRDVIAQPIKLTVSCWILSADSLFCIAWIPHAWALFPLHSSIPCWHEKCHFWELGSCQYVAFP